MRREELIKGQQGILKVHHLRSSSSLQFWQQWSKTGIREMADTTRIRMWCRSYQLLAHVGCLVIMALDVVCWGQEISRELDVCEFWGRGFVPKLHVLMQILGFSQVTKLLGRAWASKLSAGTWNQRLRILVDTEIWELPGPVHFAYVALRRITFITGISA